MLQTTAPRRLLRDRDGCIHAPCGFLTRKRYDAMRAKFPEKQFPDPETIPLMSDLSDGDLEAWYGTKAKH